MAASRVECYSAGMPVRRIISGGQTGADRAGLDVALELGLEAGGYCPRGRRAEDGIIPEKYPLTELPTPSYPPRTAANVRAADATLIFTLGAPDRGTALTLRIAAQAKKPVLTLDLSELGDHAAAERLTGWLALEKPEILNVAGSRESKAPGLYARVRSVLRAVLEHR